MYYRGNGIRLREDECSLCGESYHYSFLRHCERCKKSYCRNCYIFEHGQVICLKCAKRLVSPQGPRSKYAYLGTYLTNRARFTNQVRLPFSELEGIIGDQLPLAAYQDKQWWDTFRNRPRSGAWLPAGWSVQNVDVKKKEVTFRKIELGPTGDLQKKRRPRRKPLSKSFKAMALKKTPRRPLEPSKTKVAMVIARAKNIERSRAVKGFKGKLKPKKAYERRLYSAEEKPEDH